MVDDQTSRLRAEIAEVEKDLAAVRETAAQLRENVAEAEDPADRGALIQSADEQDTIAEQLTARRDDLRQRVAQAEHG
jgi:septal ring factor EnvC (AmiA/AmiB activator)